MTYGEALDFAIPLAPVPGGTLFMMYRPFFEKNKKLYIKMEILYKTYDYEEKNI